MSTELFPIPDSDEMPVISLWQPWAQWVILGWKTIETREHNRFRHLAGKRLGIHAAKHWDKNAISAAVSWLSVDQIKETQSWLYRDDIRGALIGTVHVITHRILTPSDEPGALIECRTLRCGLDLTNPVRLVTPQPMTGRQGIWRARLPSK